MRFTNDKAIYIQIAEYVMEKILLGEWNENDKILSVRDFGSELEVNPNTVMRAYEGLQQKGIIYNKRGLGFFVSEGSKDGIMKLKREQFIDDELPVFFRSMDLLNISIDDINMYYNNRAK